MLETIRREVGFYDMIYRIVLRIGIFVSSVNVSEIGHAKMSCRGGSASEIYLYNGLFRNDMRKMASNRQAYNQIPFTFIKIVNNRELLMSELLNLFHTIKMESGYEKSNVCNPCCCRVGRCVLR